MHKKKFGFFFLSSFFKVSFKTIYEILAPTFAALIPAHQLGRFAPSGFALAFSVASLPQALCFAFAFSVASLPRALYFVLASTLTPCATLHLHLFKKIYLYCFSWMNMLCFWDMGQRSESVSEWVSQWQSSFSY